MNDEALSIKFSGNYNGEITLEYLPCINYAMIHNQIPAFKFCILKNTDEKDWKAIKVSITGEYVKPVESIIETIQAGKALQIGSMGIVVDANKLIQLTEGIHTQFKLSITIDGEVAYEHDYPFFLMAFDQWTGTSVLPELLAAFVTPNLPLLSRVSVKASGFLNQWTGDSDLDEYQTENPNRVRMQVAAIYEALRSEALVYSTPPASFEAFGQRIRLADKVLTEKLGTCVDLTLLFASCLEANGIHPLLILLKGHIFAGAWLIPNNYTKVVSDDGAFLLKECADGVNEIVMVECTALSSSQNVSFDDAVRMAEKEIKEEGRFDLFIDVFRCRLDNIKPLPLRVSNNGVLEIQNEGIEHVNATTSVTQLNHFDLHLDDKKQAVTKQMIWERKLLDFSLRNNLINTKVGKRIIPFISFDIDHLEDHLQAGENYQILPAPTNRKLESNKYGIYNSSLYQTELGQLIAKDLENKRIYSYLTDAELRNALKYVYRTSRTSLEENGANSLFLTLGLLKWYETEKSEMPRFAPILLLPVDIIRRGGLSGYVIRTRDEEIILNITMVELLKQQFNIELKGLVPLPQDQSGVDVKLIFTIIRSCIKEMHGWDVIEESTLGLFSFNKFVMWNDIHNNADKLRENRIIDSLMENRIEWDDINTDTDARRIDKTCEPKAFAIPVDVDSSQMEAVVESGEGKNFILYGPPGTGKSQTITNMIANALYKGKRVLFVAEKMAALSVVQNRLDKIGLAPFCLEMHSNKATKTHFLEQLQQALDVTHIQSPAEYEKLSADLFERRKELIGYMEALHQPRESGYSLYEYIMNYLYIDGGEVTVDDDVLDGMNKERLAEIRESLKSLDTVFRISGHPKGNPLSGLYPKDSSKAALDSVHGTLQSILSLTDKIADAKRFFTERIGLNAVPDNRDGYAWIGKVCDVLLSLKALNKGLLDTAGNQELAEEWKRVVACGRERDSVKAALLKDFREEILQVDAFALRQEWEGIQQQWFLSKVFAKRACMKRLRMYNPALEESQVSGLIDSLDTIHRQEKVVDSHAKEFSESFGFMARSGAEKWDDILRTLQSASTLHDLLVAYSKATSSDLSKVISGLLDHTASDWNSFRQSNDDSLHLFGDSVRKFQDELNKLEHLCDAVLPDGPISTELPSLLQRWIAGFGKATDWYHWCTRRRLLIDQKLGMAVDYIEKGHTGAETSDALFKGVCHQKAMKAVDADESLRLFNGLLFEEMIRKYKEMTMEFQKLTKVELYARLAARIPSLSMEAASGSEVGILKRNIANGGRGTSIRRIIDQIPTLLPKLCPCMLMSPISVAQFVDLNADKFDLVIFDEASQMPTSEAVGAIARGKTLVVVGDPKQMPPTNFFSSSQVDEEEADVDDMESILDDCISMSMPSHYLTWHYRSKHESLITFSNLNYYDGRLLTFPSVDDRASKVHLVHIDGVYDKGRTRSNRAEAMAIVNEIIRRLNDEQLSQRSIGVVSFSKVQQNLIEDLLIDELSKYPELEKKAYNSEEPVFIKNLENVQGDERDIILFSVGYGPDKEGHVSMNFGPLNNQGGERRLNVAVSRARYEMIIYSTLMAEQIDLKRTQSKGVEGLKNFLSFAEHGTMAIPVTSTSLQSGQSLVTLIADAITRHGYKADTEVGSSNFKVDIAIIDPENEGQYLLGILCDGKNYYETKTTRDREIVQPNVLALLHWNVMRIWSIDWYDDREKVIERILSRIEEAKRSRDEDAQQDQILAPNIKSSAFNISNEPVVVQVNEAEMEYVFANIDPTNGPSDVDTVIAAADRVSQQLRNIIAVEQPITHTLLYKRISNLWNLNRVTARLQTMIDTLLSPYFTDHLSNTQRVYWENVDKSKEYKRYRIHSNRDILDIPMIEVMNAARYVVGQQLSLPKADLKRLTGQLLGFSRVGTNVDNSIECALQALIALGIFMEKDEQISGVADRK